MSRTARPAGLLALVSAFVFALFAASANANTQDVIMPQEPTPSAKDGWQAGTCKSDKPVKCSPETPSLFYTQAGGHPPIGFTQYIIKHGEEIVQMELEGGGTTPVPVLPLVTPIEGRTIKTLRVDLPPGFTVNPEAAPKCSLADFEREVEVAPGVKLHIPNCPKGSIVGREEVTLVVNTAGVVPAPLPFKAGTKLPVGFVIPPTYELAGTPPTLGVGTRPPVYNLQPNAGEPALFGFVVAGKEEVFLETEVAWENDFHESFRIKLPPASPPFSTLKSRLINFGQDAGNLEIEPGGEFKVGGEEAGDGTYLNTPITCYNPNEWPHLYSTWFRAESYEEEDPNFPFGSSPVEAKLPPGAEPTGCDKAPFDPAVEVDPGTTEVDSPSGATVNTTLKWFTGEESEVQESHLKRAVETLPEGMALNPASANGLVACTEAQFKKGMRTYDNECPAASKVGTVEIETPVLSPGLLKGDIYVGEQKSSNPESGEMFRIFVEAKSLARGIDLRLLGHVKANATTGQLTTVFDEQITGELAGQLPQGLPQAPFTAVRLHFDESKAVLTSPPTCSTAETTGELEPWARPGTTVPVSSKFTLTAAPGGGACPESLGARPFSPGYSAGTLKTKAGSYSTFELHVSRPDGAQEFRRIETELPPGMVAKLRGVEYCPEASIAAISGRTGTEELAAPSCPSNSLVGTLSTDVGSGPNPLHMSGNVYFAGPYKGAPVSLVFVTPAVTGPFDLGNVVVRVALNINPETVQVRAVSDPIPYVFGGVKLDIRKIDVSVNRKGYTVNPTNCSPFSVNSSIFGGGSNPANPAEWFQSSQGSPFQATGCSSLKFKPKFTAEILGGKKQMLHSAHPKLQAILEPRKGDANVQRALFILPHATILDQSHIRTVCTKVQLAASSCPKQAIYGNAEAKSPLIKGVLKGPVYLTSSEHELPDLLADLHGQVNVRLRGVISSVHGRLKTVFPQVPDVAVSKFILTMKGGNRGLLVNTGNLCKKKRVAFLKLKAQNGKKLKNKHLALKLAGCQPKKKKH